MKTLKRVLFALLLTIAPTAVLLAAVETYNPSSACGPDTLRGGTWIICPMTNTSGCNGDWSMQLAVQAAGYTGCALTVEGPGVTGTPIAGYWEMGLGRRSGSDHAGCNGLYNYYKDKGGRFLRCRSETGPAPINFSVDFARNSLNCIPPTP